MWRSFLTTLLFRYNFKMTRHLVALLSVVSAFLISSVVIMVTNIAQLPALASGTDCPAIYPTLIKLYWCTLQVAQNFGSMFILDVVHFLTKSMSVDGSTLKTISDNDGLSELDNTTY